MTEQRKNSYEDSDFRRVLADIEALEDEARSIRAEAAGRCSGIAKRIANEIKTAKALGIPKSVLNPIRKQRKLERQLDENAKSVADDAIELFEDASGQFSIFAPQPDEPVKEPVAKRAARRAKKAAAENEAKEQEEGARVLDELAGAPVN